MAIAPDAAFCIPTASLDAWTASTGSNGQATTATDVQQVLQMAPGRGCAADQTRLHVNTGSTAAYLVAYDARLPSVADATFAYGLGFGMIFALRPLGLGIVEIRKLARKALG